MRTKEKEKKVRGESCQAAKETGSRSRGQKQ